jgi:hypothetical protein
MNIHSIFNVILPFFRRSRMRRFMDTFSPTEDVLILDVGGTEYNWTLVKCNSQITLLNLSVPDNQTSDSQNIHYVQGDGTQLQYADDEFDICYSNSVIEHLGTYESQLKFAGELRRVGKRVWVQTPAKSFFVEPHLITPLIHYLPKALQKKLLRNFTVWGWITRPDQNTVDRFLQEIRLLSFDEMKALFPDCKIYKERFIGFTKAFIAVRE